jgi:hypothetical protein
MHLKDIFRKSLEYTHVQAFIMSSVFSILLYMLTHLIGGLNPIVAATFSTFAGLMSFLIFERQFISDKFQTIETNILANLKNRVYARKFKDIRETVNYVSQNAKSCSTIMNTRFLSHSNIPINEYNRIMSDHDAAIVSAIEDGCNYQMVVDVRGSHTLKGSILCLPWHQLIPRQKVGPCSIGLILRVRPYCRLRS